VDGTEVSIVMIIGSDAEFVYLMQYYATTTGHQAIVAPIDGDVVDLAAQNKPAMVVLDPDLLEPASLGLLSALKADRSTRDIPVLVCSWQDEEASLLCRKADGYLQKPVSYEAFLDVLTEVAHVSGA
jgi:DNA-binding response OmpR family regulator